MPINYSKWDNIEISDDEDDPGSQHIEKGLLARLRHQRRLENMVLAKRERETVSKRVSEAAKSVSEIQLQLNADETSNDRDQLDRRLSEAEKQHQKWLEKEKELRQMEAKAPLNIDNICHTRMDGTRILEEPAAKVDLKADVRKMSQADMDNFLHANREELVKLARLSTLEQTVQMLKEKPTLCNPLARDVLLVFAVDHEMAGNSKMVKWILKQNMLIAWIVEKAIELDVKEISASFIQVTMEEISRYISKSTDLYKAELKQLQRVVTTRAAMRKKEQEVREVVESLPQLMRESFIERDVNKLYQAVNEVGEEEFSKHFERCKQVGLWVSKPSTREEEEEEEEYNLPDSQSKDDQSDDDDDATAEQISPNDKSGNSNVASSSNSK